MLTIALDAVGHLAGHIRNCHEQSHQILIKIKNIFSLAAKMRNIITLLKEIEQAVNTSVLGGFLG